MRRAPLCSGAPIVWAWLSAEPRLPTCGSEGAIPSTSTPVFQSEGQVLAGNPPDASNRGRRPRKEYPMWQAALLDGAVRGA